MAPLMMALCSKVPYQMISYYKTGLVAGITLQVGVSAAQRDVYGLRDFKARLL